MNIEEKHTSSGEHGGKQVAIQGPSRQEAPRMFNRIARRYDLLNRVLSLRQDVHWRKKMAEELPPYDDLAVLDIATGTADVLLTLKKKCPRVRCCMGVDPARNMLQIGREKIRQRGWEKEMMLLPADGVWLPFRAEWFDVVTIAFGIRNVPDVLQALREMHRVLRIGGRAIILEFSLPHPTWFRHLYLFYFRNILPKIGGLISGDNYAYQYLNRTVETFPYGEDFLRLMHQAGFENLHYRELTLGIATIYVGEKKATGSQEIKTQERQEIR